MTDVATWFTRARRFRTAGALLALALTTGLAGAAHAATTPPDTTPSVYSAIVPHKFASKALAASETYSRQVAGSTTTVPGTATSVQLQLTVSGGSANGDLKVYPLGGSTGSVDNLRWATGKTVTTQFVVGVGAGEKVTFQNGPGAVTLDISVTGYYAPAGAAGPAGGVLTGTYPNPGLAPAAVSPVNVSAGGSSNGQVLTSNGSTVSWQTPPYEGKLTNSIVVHPTGNGTVDGNLLRTAVSLGYPLVVLEPGSYELGSSNLTLPSGVSLAGGGPQNTTILSSGAVTGITASGTQTISGIAVLDVGGGSSVNAIDVTGGTVNLIHDVVSATGSAVESAVRVLNSASLVVDDTTVTSTSTGVFSQSVLVNQSTAQATIVNSTLVVTTSGSGNQGLAVNAFGPAAVRNSTITVTSSGGALAEAVVVQGGALTAVYNSQVTGTDYSLLALSGTIRAAGSQLAGTAHANSGQTLTCVGDFSSSFVALNTACL